MPLAPTVLNCGGNDGAETELTLLAALAELEKDGFHEQLTAQTAYLLEGVEACIHIAKEQNGIAVSMQDDGGGSGRAIRLVGNDEEYEGAWYTQREEAAGGFGNEVM